MIQESNPVFIEDKIESRSEKGKFHCVKLYEDGTSNCDCIAGEMKRYSKPPDKECWHKKEMRRLLEEEYGHMWLD